MRIFLLLFVVSAVSQAQPYINHRGVFNAASYMPQSIPGGAIAQGSIFTIFGRDFGPTTPSPPLSFPLATSLAGVSLQLMQGTTTLAAIPIYVSANQINAILPSNTPVGEVSLRVIYNGVNSNWMTIQVVPVALGLFAINSGGFGPGVIQNAESATSLPVNSSRVTAKPGQTAVFWATGLGGVANDREAPAATDVPRSVEMFVGGKAAARIYAGRSPCCSGLDQLVFRIPDDAPQGCHVPVVVRSGGLVSNTVTMAVEAQGGTCRDAHNTNLEKLRAGGKVGSLASARFVTLFDVDPRAAYEETVDQFALAIRKEAATEYYSNPVSLVPPLGTCVTYSIMGDAVRNRLPRASIPAASLLDAGAEATLESSSGTIRIRRTGVLYSRMIDSPFAFGGTDPFRIGVPGGADVGAFSATVAKAAALNWTNRSTLARTA